MFYQHLRTTNDRNGNPRRLFAVYSQDGTMLAAIDEGYEGLPKTLRFMVELPPVNITPNEYRRILKTYHQPRAQFTHDLVS